MHRTTPWRCCQSTSSRSPAWAVPTHPYTAWLPLPGRPLHSDERQALRHPCCHPEAPQTKSRLGCQATTIRTPSCAPRVPSAAVRRRAWHRNPSPGHRRASAPLLPGLGEPKRSAPVRAMPLLPRLCNPDPSTGGLCNASSAAQPGTSSAVLFMPVQCGAAGPRPTRPRGGEPREAKAVLPRSTPWRSCLC
jgi:hypothetical protein